MTDIETRLQALETRLKALEDETAILRLIACYGPAVDSCDRDAVGALWSENGGYDFGGPPLAGRQAVGGLVDLDTHRAYVAAGSGHVLSLPVVTVKGNRATAINYSRVYVKHGDHWRVARMSANHWDLTREDDGQWRVKTRTNRLLDGSEEARAVLSGGLDR